jgi:DNA polymerase-3 subunit alpha
MTGSIELALWNEKKYLEFEKFLKPDVFLFVRACAQLRYNTTDKYEISILDLGLLSETGNKNAKSITIITNTDELTEEAMDHLYELLKQNAGRIPLKFSFLNREEQYKAEGVSRKLRVSFNTSMLEKLEEISPFTVKVN